MRSEQNYQENDDWMMKFIAHTHKSKEKKEWKRKKQIDVHSHAHSAWWKCVQNCEILLIVFIDESENYKEKWKRTREKKQKKKTPVQKQQ